MSLDPEMKARLDAEIKDNDVVLYMKGTGDFPMCGFSARAAQVLKASNVRFKSVNILEDDNLRVSLKEFSEWPTFPQCYIKGEFIGGSDILLEMYETGDLAKKLEGAAKATA
jgi:monothiol glutaredoxin